MRWISLLVLCACNELYGLESTNVAPMPDRDGDGALDDSDNCPDDSNADQSDDDGDGLGDRCDNCPIVPNTDQRDYDGDKLGDFCDPHPGTGDDCLVVYDTFADPAAFDAHWSLATIGGAQNPLVKAQAGHVELTPTSVVGAAAWFVLDDNGNMIQGPLDVLLRGKSTLTGGLLQIISNAPDPSLGIQCQLRLGTADPQVAAMIQNGTAKQEVANLMKTAHVTDGVMMRLLTPHGNDFGELCRVDYGVAIQLAKVSLSIAAPQGGAGIGFTGGLTGGSIDIEGIVLSRVVPAGDCPPKILR